MHVRRWMIGVWALGPVGCYSGVVEQDEAQDGGTGGSEGEASGEGSSGGDGDESGEGGTTGEDAVDRGLEIGVRRRSPTRASR
jgi:hypothetical protein